MFRKNTQHEQAGLLETVEQLPEKVRQRLEGSWAGTFYRELFCRINEAVFAELYSAKCSRPNTPVNVLVGLEVVKSGFGWSDEELYDAFLFDLQVRYALGIRDLASGNFELRTLYNFRQRVSAHMQQQGVNLLEHVFEQVTGEQLVAFGLTAGEQRMDATYLASNIRQMSRLQLLVEIVQRVWRMLDAPDQGAYEALFAPYHEGTAGQYCYRVRQADIPSQLQAVGVLLQRLVGELASKYGAQPGYALLQQVLREHFTVQAADEPPVVVQVKPNAELAADSLQSPDDREATFRQIGAASHRGYKANLTETCAPDNPFQLVTDVQVAPNLTDDQELMKAAVADLQPRTGLITLWTDGGFTGQQASAVVCATGIQHIPTGVRGHAQAADRLGWDAFNWELDAEGRAQQVTCPGGQCVPVVPGTPARGLAHFDAARCLACKLLARCHAKPNRRQSRFTLYFSFRCVQVALARQRCQAAQGPGRNRRAAVESLMRSVKHPFGGQKGKLPVRGQVRVTMLIVASALMINVRRIWRYCQSDDPLQTAAPIFQAAARPGDRPAAAFHQHIRHLFHLRPVSAPTPLIF